VLRRGRRLVGQLLCQEDGLLERRLGLGRAGQAHLLGGLCQVCLGQLLAILGLVRGLGHQLAQDGHRLLAGGDRLERPLGLVAAPGQEGVGAGEGAGREAGAHEPGHPQAL
jgi:hypothetical protein